MLGSETLYDWLSLRLVPEMNRARFYALFQKFPNPDAIFSSTISELVKIRGFSPQLAASVLVSHATDRGKRHMDQMGRAGIMVVTRDCPEYPYNLAHSSLAPPMIFVKGTLVPEDKYSVALVGSRHATSYGRSVARELAGGLARYGLTVVSGFARGIDGEAHHAAVLAGGRTLAVLGNGLDVCYPSEHRALVEEVIANGALLSEYPLGTPPERYNFPERNHVIASLSLGTIVVEAAEKSGSLITARLAVEENRFVFAVPGDITRNNSRGANVLIQNGAHLVQRAQDVLVDMKDQLRGYLDVDELELAKPEPPAEPAKAPSKPEVQPAPALAEGDRRTKGVPDWVDAIDGLDPAGLEDLARKLDLGPVSAVNETLAAIKAVESPAPAPTPDPLPEPVTHVPINAADTIVDPVDNRAFMRGADWDVSEARTEIIGIVPKLTPRPAQKPMPLSEEELFIVGLLHHEAMVFDEIAERAFNRGMDVPRLTSLLMKLELKKVIKQLPGRYYVKFT